MTSWILCLIFRIWKFWLLFDFRVYILSSCLVAGIDVSLHSAEFKNLIQERFLIANQSFLDDLNNPLVKLNFVENLDLDQSKQFAAYVELKADIELFDVQTRESRHIIVDLFSNPAVLRDMV